MLFLGNSNVEAPLCLSVKCNKGSLLSDKQYQVLFKSCFSFMYDKTFCRDQLHIYRLGSKPSKGRLI